MEALASLTELLFPFDAMSGLAHYYHSLPLAYVFTTVQFILTACAIRREPGSVQFAFKHPIASCVMTFLVAHSGTILASAALGKPLVECLLNPYVVFSCIAIWYLIFFSPFDICYALSLFTPLRLVLCVIQEFGRSKKVLSGVITAHELYPSSMLIVTFVGMLKGSGKMWGITWYRLISNSENARTHELLAVSFATKIAFFLGLLYAYNQVNDALLMDQAHLLTLGAVFLSVIKLWHLLLREGDPLASPQLATWGVLTALSVEPPQRGVPHPPRSDAPHRAEGKAEHPSSVATDKDKKD